MTITEIGNQCLRALTLTLQNTGRTAAYAMGIGAVYEIVLQTYLHKKDVIDEGILYLQYAYTNAASARDNVDEGLDQIINNSTLHQWYQMFCTIIPVEVMVSCYFAYIGVWAALHTYRLIKSWIPTMN